MMLNNALIGILLAPFAFSTARKRLRLRLLPSRKVQRFPSFNFLTDGPKKLNFLLWPL